MQLLLLYEKKQNKKQSKQMLKLEYLCKKHGKW